MKVNSNSNYLLAAPSFCLWKLKICPQRFSLTWAWKNTQNTVLLQCQQKCEHAGTLDRLKMHIKLYILYLIWYALAALHINFTLKTYLYFTVAKVEQSQEWSVASGIALKLWGTIIKKESDVLWVFSLCCCMSLFTLIARNKAFARLVDSHTFLINVFLCLHL